MATDLLFISLAWVLAYWFRFQSGLVEVDKGVPEFTHYLSQLLFIWLIWAFVFKRVGLYRPMRGVRRMHEVALLIRANVFSVVLLIAVTYLFREKDIPFSRLVFVYFGVAATVITIIQRSIVRFVLREIRRKGYNLRYLLVIGAEKTASDIVSRVRLHKELGIQLVGCLARSIEEKRGPGVSQYRLLQ